MSIWTLPTALQARLNGRMDGAKERPSQNGQSISYYSSKSLRNHRNSNNHWHEVLCATDFEQKICKMADRGIRLVYEKWQSRDAKLIGKQKTWEEKFKQSEENYLIRKRELERDAIFDATPWWYVPLIIVFGIAELAMNAEVFDIFGSARFETIIMALILSFAIPMSGHFWGRFLREDEKEKPLIFLSVGCLAVIVFSLYSLAAVRNSYFKIQSTTDAETVFNAWLFFLSLNFLVFLISIYASWYAHERDFKLFKFKRDYMAALSSLNKLGSRRNALKASCHNQIFRLRDAAHERVSIYRQHNLRKRSDDRRPQAFEALPDILIPEFEEESFATNGKARSAYLLTD